MRFFCRNSQPQEATPVIEKRCGIPDIQLLEKRLEPDLAGKRVKNYLATLTLELQTLARANGKSDVRNLEPEDLAALTVEAAAMARVPLAGTTWIPGYDK